MCTLFNLNYGQPNNAVSLIQAVSLEYKVKQLMSCCINKIL